MGSSPLRTGICTGNPPGGTVSQAALLSSCRTTPGTGGTGEAAELGLHQVEQLMDMPRAALRRRFGAGLLLRLDQAFRQGSRNTNTAATSRSFREWLPSLEAIRTATGIIIALKQLLDLLCGRLEKEVKDYAPPFLNATG